MTSSAAPVPSADLLADGDANRPVSLSARMLRAGFTDPDAAAAALLDPAMDLWDAGSNAAPDPGSAAVVSALGRTADPDRAIAVLVELAHTDDGSEIVARLKDSAVFRARLLPLLGSSVALGDHVLTRPQVAVELSQVQDWTAHLLAAERRIAVAVGADPDDPVTGTSGTPARLTGPDAVLALRAAYRDELVAVAAADLAGEIELGDVMAALADLAGAALRASLAVALAALGPDPAPCRLAVIAMGKTGARELNYVSDVDVIFVAEPDGTDRAHESDALGTAARMASEMMRVCGQACWEVDANLRPEGKQGVLVRTVASHAAYYRRWASTWEFQALLKARPIAGDDGVAQAYLDEIMPMVWSAADRPDFVTDVQAMRRRVVDHLPADILDREIKLGPGGLRDVEFAVQLLQLVHGRVDEALRTRATLPALVALSERGYVGKDDAVSLLDAYAFLRRTEHALQLSRLRRTHLVPEDGPARLRLARTLGFRPDARGDSVAVFDSEWALHAREVRRLHEKLFYRPLLEAVARVPSEMLRMSPDQARIRLAALGFADPAGALRHIDALTNGVSRRANIQRALLPAILSDLADVPDPDGGLLAYRQVSEALGDTPWFLRLLRDSGAVATRLATILGTSRYAADLLARAPEALQMLSADEELVPRRRAEIEVAMTTAARRQADPERAARVIRGLRRIELLRIAFAELLGLATDSQIRIALSVLSEATLAATLAVAMRTVGAEHGRDDLGFEFAVMAMGRLGGQEVGYGSDADVLFVYRPAAGRDADVASGGPAQVPVERLAIAVAERLRSMLSTPSTDPPLLIDANLRPEGRDGALVRSLASYAEYYARWASVWEAQALLRARFCAGSAALGADFLDLIEPIRYPEGGQDQAGIAEVRRIKGRVDSERLPRGADRSTHTKLGPGGLADVEWTVQLLQLRYAYAIPGLRTTATLSALRTAAAAGLVTADDEAALEASWRLAGRVRNAIVLVRDKADDQLPRPGKVLTAVGRVLGYRPGFDTGQFVDDYLRAARRARRVVEAVFYDSEL